MYENSDTDDSREGRTFPISGEFSERTETRDEY